MPTEPSEEIKQPPKGPQQPKGRRRMLLVLALVIFALAQLAQPGKNNQQVISRNGVEAAIQVPDSVQQVLRRACYDCHSNFTNYPWYANLQPGGWWLYSHINEGKEHLNFDEFADMRGQPGLPLQQLQVKKLRQIAASVQEGSMPLASYKWLHPEARLTVAERQLIIEWAVQAESRLADGENTR